MAWTPDNNVFDERGARDALIAYFEDNQVEALAWANDNAVPALAPVAKFHKSAREVRGVFPSLMFLRTSHTSEFKGDFLLVKFAIELEFALQHGNQDTLINRSAKYSMALESMLANVPQTTFGENSKIDITAQISALETTFDIQGKMKSGFIQIFQTSAAWNIEARAIE